MKKEEDAMINYLDDLFIEDKKEIRKLLKEVEVKYACTFFDLFKAFIEFDDFNEKRSIILPLNYFKKISNYGINGCRAGEMLRHYLIIKRIMGEK